ncbi:MAG: bifunctional oligoribonuclease/PAP phosphatase NrnA [Oscillospiraceae bacterium]|nr:bifunctional oligoribonuclease/PAP phosphatase NrnA [Oscillospiraceae bacterium]
MDFKDIKEFLQSCEDAVILTHKSPDGDTFGSAFALCRVLRKMGKRVNVLCSDGFPERYSFLYEGCEGDNTLIEPKCVIAVDIADVTLMGKNLACYQQEGAVDLCIDHHISNKHYAKKTYVDADASATALVLYELFKYMEVEIDTQTASCLYTGIATDTGCFKYENTTVKAHLAAAELISMGVPFASINRRMFDLKSRSRIMVEQIATSNIEYYFGGKLSMIVITKELMENSGAEDSEFDGIASIPISVEGVKMGITVKQRGSHTYKLSVRTTDELDASQFCKSFGGGGHIRAAGCEIQGGLDEVRGKILELAGKYFGVQ